MIAGVSGRFRWIVIKNLMSGLFPDAYLDRFSYDEQEGDWWKWFTSRSSDVLLIAENQVKRLLGIPWADQTLAELILLRANSFPSCCKDASGDGYRPKTGRGNGRSTEVAWAADR